MIHHVLHVRLIRNVDLNCLNTSLGVCLLYLSAGLEQAIVVDVGQAKLSAAGGGYCE